MGTSSTTDVRGATRPRGALALLGLLALSTTLAAHDHWIAPARFAPALGERIDVHLCVGCPGQFELQVRDPRHARRFEVLGPSGAARPLLGIDGRAPAALFLAKEAGVHVLVFQSDYASVEIEPAKYAEYLRVEGLEDVQAVRERRGELGTPGRDAFARCDKALVRAESGPTTGFDRVVGLPLELVAETDPFAWRPGDELTFRLLLAGEPLAGRQIKLMHLAEPHTIELARTDAEGRARFEPARTGGFVASCVHQTRARPEQELAGDWEALWTSLAFELGSADAGLPTTGAPRSE